MKKVYRSAVYAVSICGYILISSSTFFSLVEDCVKQLYAGPTGKWGKFITIQNCFGEKVGCKFSTSETPIEAPIRYQVKLNDGKWREYKEGDFVYGQDIKARASSTLTGGYVKILTQCSCKCD